MIYWHVADISTPQPTWSNCCMYASLSSIFRLVTSILDRTAPSCARTEACRWCHTHDMIAFEREWF